MTSLNKDSTFDRDDLSEMMQKSQAGKTQKSGASRPQTASTFGANDRDNAAKMQ